MTNRILFAACASAMLMTSATAQSPVLQDGRIQALFQPGRQDGFVRVQSSLNFFVPAPAGDSEDAQKSREKARRMIYETAAREFAEGNAGQGLPAGKHQQQHQHQSPIRRRAAGRLYDQRIDELSDHPEIMAALSLTQHYLQRIIVHRED